MSNSGNSKKKTGALCVWVDVRDNHLIQFGSNYHYLTTVIINCPQSIVWVVSGKIIPNDNNDDLNIVPSTS